MVVVEVEVVVVVVIVVAVVVVVVVVIVEDVVVVVVVVADIRSKGRCVQQSLEEALAVTLAEWQTCCKTQQQMDYKTSLGPVHNILNKQADLHPSSQAKGKTLSL